MPNIYRFGDGDGSVWGDAPWTKVTILSAKVKFRVQSCGHNGDSTGNSGDNGYTLNNNKPL